MGVLFVAAAVVVVAPLLVELPLFSGAKVCFLGPWAEILGSIIAHLWIPCSKSRDFAVWGLVVALRMSLVG